MFRGFALFYFLNTNDGRAHFLFEGDFSLDNKQLFLYPWTENCMTPCFYTIETSKYDQEDSLVPEVL